MESATDPVAFAEKLLSLLDTGRKTATYKFATLAALIDLCTEQAVTDDTAIALSAFEVGRRVFDQFWRQAVPLTVHGGDTAYLHHSILSRDHQPDLVVKIERFRASHGLGSGATPEQAAARVPVEFASLRDDVAVTVIRMPLPKLQRFRVGGRVVEDRFLYDYGWPDEVAEGKVRSPGFDDALHLRRGVAALLARLGGLLRPVIEARWAAYVTERSHHLVEAHDVAEFLFGADRIALTRLRDPLLDLQDGGCFYCDDPIGAACDVDHFIPWSRHPDNGIDNLVAAHRSCNNHKRDSMAGTDHLARWIDRNTANSADIQAISSSTNWPRQSDRTRGAARATYLWLPVGTKLWVRQWDYEPLDQARLHNLLA